MTHIPTFPHSDHTHTQAVTHTTQILTQVKMGTHTPRHMLRLVTYTHRHPPPERTRVCTDQHEHAVLAISPSRECTRTALLHMPQEPLITHSLVLSVLVYTRTCLPPHTRALRHTHTLRGRELGTVSAPGVSTQEQSDDREVLAATRLSCPVGWTGLGTPISLPAEVAPAQAVNGIILLDQKPRRSPQLSGPPLSLRLKCRACGPNSPPKPHPLGVILTDTGVGDVVAGDGLHVLASCAQVAITAREPPRPTLYLRGHGELGAECLSLLRQVQCSRPSWNWRELTSLPLQSPLPSPLLSSP